MFETTKKKLLAGKWLVAIEKKWYQFKLLCSLFKHYLVPHPVPPAPLQSKFLLQPTDNRSAASSGFTGPHSEGKYGLSSRAGLPKIASFPGLCRKSLHPFSHTRKNTYPSAESAKTNWREARSLSNTRARRNKPAPRLSHSIAPECRCGNYYGWDFPRRVGLWCHPLVRDSWKWWLLNPYLVLNTQTDHPFHKNSCVQARSQPAASAGMAALGERWMLSAKSRLCHNSLLY